MRTVLRSGTGTLIRDALLPVYVVRVWKIGAGMSTPTLFAAEGGSDDEPAHGQETGYAPRLWRKTRARTECAFQRASLFVEDGRRGP